jgi:hypothetical protein
MRCRAYQATPPPPPRAQKGALGVLGSGCSFPRAAAAAPEHDSPGIAAFAGTHPAPHEPDGAQRLVSCRKHTAIRSTRRDPQTIMGPPRNIAACRRHTPLGWRPPASGGPWPAVALLRYGVAARSARAAQPRGCAGRAPAAAPAPFAEGLAAVATKAARAAPHPYPRRPRRNRRVGLSLATRPRRRTSPLTGQRRGPQ